MPLYPPAEPVEHPADLVIDAFGTFLGKRSERMIVRWRNVGQTQTAAQPLAATLRVPGPKPESASQILHDNQNQSVIENSVVPTEPQTSTADLQDGCPTGPTSADEVLSQLIELWARQSPPPTMARPAPAARIEQQLEPISEEPASRTAGGWLERAVPLSRLRSVTVAGRGITVSSDLIEALVGRGIGLSFLSGRGQPVAQLSSPGLGGTVQTRRSQLAAYETSLGVELAVEFIRGKLRNQKHQLQYSGKYLKSADALRYEQLVKKIKALGGIRKRLIDFQGEKLEDVRDQLMGFEGTGARIYWEGVSIVLEGRVDFPGRVTRGAIDPVNSALNYGYGILYGRVSAAVVNAGLEMYAGFLHVDRPGKPSLVLDLVEEFRAPVVDRAILAIVNQGIELETDAHGLTVATRKQIAERVLERLATPVPFEGKRWPLGTVIQHQARHLAVAVRGDRDYRAFASRW